MRPLAAVAVLLLSAATTTAEPRALHVSATGQDVQAWDVRLAALRASGELRHERTQEDDLPGRQHVRLAQVHRGVPVYGGQVVQQVDATRTVSVFGTLYEGVDVDPDPRVDAEAARAAVTRHTGVRTAKAPELLVFPLAGGGYELAWKLRVFAKGDLRLVFVSAVDGRIVYERSDLQAQSPQPGLGTGVLNDSKKVSATHRGSTYYAFDELRPPDIVTFDLKGNVVRLIDFLNGEIALGFADVAQDTDNTWTDGAVVDAHSYAGWTYDYLFKRFGRRGLDDRDMEILNVVHPIRRDLFFTLSDEEYDDLSALFANAFYAGGGLMVYGVGLPPNVRLGGQSYDYMSGMLDVVAHELAHGVTDYSSGLVYEGESGALNESFSDMIGTGAEFFHHQAGSGSLRADYLIGEDAIVPGGIRSMADPAAYGDPDHYSRRYTGSADNGGVHINSGIPNQVYYLAIEGGRNRTSGLTVTGVGVANREQVERVMYRAFTRMMTPRTDFRGARAATLQAAADLYGASSPVHAALTQAWNAVGVN